MMTITTAHRSGSSSNCVKFFLWISIRVDLFAAPTIYSIISQTQFFYFIYFWIACNLGCIDADTRRE